mmetsp:Transcript_31867/g.83185  ORF Transcript_31867/g.83185 Transcript_31867/m.83185 type:complete len:243 (-) Transcript_31867:123-851(-)
MERRGSRCAEWGISAVLRRGHALHGVVWRRAGTTREGWVSRGRSARVRRIPVALRREARVGCMPRVRVARGRPSSSWVGRVACRRVLGVLPVLRRLCWCAARGWDGRSSGRERRSRCSSRYRCWRTLCRCTVSTPTCQPKFLCPPFRHVLFRYALRSVYLHVHSCTAFDCVRHFCQLRLVHFVAVVEEGNARYQLARALRALKVLGLLVLQQHQLVIKLTLAVPAPWLELLMLFLAFPSHGG